MYFGPLGLGRNRPKTIACPWEMAVSPAADSALRQSVLLHRPMQQNLSLEHTWHFLAGCRASSLRAACTHSCSNKMLGCPWEVAVRSLPVGRTDREAAGGTIRQPGVLAPPGNHFEYHTTHTTKVEMSGTTMRQMGRMWWLMTYKIN